jgi:molybdenum cofactor cytidylyltransferase
MTTLPAIVLAAGASSRMGRPKALLPLDTAGTTFARAVCTALAAGGAAPIVLVTRAALREPLVHDVPDVTLVVNPDPDRGQLSSLLAGLAALERPAAVLMTLVDVPLVRPSTVRALVDAWQATDAPLVRPVHAGRHGHPVVFGAALLDALRRADPAAGAKPVVRAFGHASIDVAVDDPGVVEDVDTPEAYARLRLP